MFKGIKKRFASNRSVRNRRLGTGVREQGEATSREPPDKGGSKSASLRQGGYAAVDQISPVPYARRSLERHSRTIPPGKNSPLSSTRSYDRHTDSFCLSPNMDTSSHVYPTTPNICVTGGKIEFISPPGSTLSSNASGIGSGKSSLHSLSPVNSPKKESPSRFHVTASNTYTNTNRSQVEKSPLKRPSKKRNSPTKAPLLALSPSSRLPVRKDSTHELQSMKTLTKGPSDVSRTGGSLELRIKQRARISTVRRSSTMPEQENSEEEIELLKRENIEVKNQLVDLQKEFQKLQAHVEELKANGISECKETKISAEKDTKISQYQVLVERCNTLEVENAQLQVDSQIQRQQYEKCLDQVASQVVQAIIVQKTQKEQCELLSKQVEKLKKQNSTLTSFIAAKGHFQSLNLPPHRNIRTHQPLLPLLCATSTSNSQSLPSTLTKSKESDCDKGNNVPDEGNTWFHIPATSNVKDIPGISLSASAALPSSCSSTLPQSKPTFKNRILHHQTSADACWYDIVKSLQSGDHCPLNSVHSASDPHNMSSDSSSLDTDEQNMRSNQRCLLPGIDDESSSSSGDDFHGASICSPLSLNEHDDTSSSLSASTSQVQPLSSNNEILNSVTSNQCSPLQLANRNSEFCVNIKTQSAIQQNLVVNFSLGSPEYNSDDNSLQNLAAKLDSGSSVVKMEDGSVSEGIIKDEGYSTMSSDVQTEVKDNVNVCTVSTVEEEKVKSFECESEIMDCSQTDTLKRSNSLIQSIGAVEKCNKKNLSLNLQANSVKNSDVNPPQEYSDGLRIVYDEEDSNSDVFFVPISEEKDKYLNHSFNFPFPNEPYHLSRCFSDSYLHKLYFRFPNCRHEVNNTKQKELNPSATQNQNFTLCSADRSNAYQTYLRRACRRESFKRCCSKSRNRPSTNSLKSKLTFNHDILSQIFSTRSHPRILSPSYSHAEMEDWSLDLSGEDLTTPGGTEPSCAESSTAPSLHQSQPSIQETVAFDMEEDHHDFLWNGATYFKADDHELSWPCHKGQDKVWELNLMGSNISHSMISPKSGCSDQPAIWSSSEQLSCCSDAASKCSTDIENFCDQLCNLPELKRISFGSSDNGAPESLNCNQKLSEVDSNEENSEALENIGVDTVFTRDFYRLVKFESSRSLTASSKSLATSEGFLTLEKLKDFESLHDSKTLASVLGFIAEQQKYCKDREKMDESVCVANSNKDVHIDKVCGKNFDNKFGLYKNVETEESNFSPDSLDSTNKGNATTCDSENILTSSESLSCLDSVNFGNKAIDDSCMNLPPKPKRSTSLNLGTKSCTSYRSRGTLPPLPSCSSPPPPPRSSSRSTLSHSHVSTVPAKHKCSTVIDEDCFPPPPPSEDPYVEPYHSIPMDSFPPSVPPHQTPMIRRRTSSKSFENGFCNSPPVPKRVTSRALPVPPSELSLPQRTTSLGNSKASHQKYYRPRSLLKDAAVSNAINKTQKQRGSCGDLAPICRNSATLIFELEKMAKAEEDEKNTCGMCSPEATSPNTEMGLGTGWVRLEPVVDLGDPHTRANLLDSMLPSSEACSSETDEDLAKQLQHKELLKAVQRNRRKRKASHHNSDHSRILGFYLPRPTILGRESLFNRFGEEEEKALMEFEFLESFPSQSDVRLVELPPKSNEIVISGQSLSDDDHSGLDLEYRSGYFEYSSSPLICRTQQHLPKLEDLRSSEPCPQNYGYSLSSTYVKPLKDHQILDPSLDTPGEEIRGEVPSENSSNLKTLTSQHFVKRDPLKIEKSQLIPSHSTQSVPLNRHCNPSAAEEIQLLNNASQVRQSHINLNMQLLRNDDVTLIRCEKNSPLNQLNISGEVNINDSLAGTSFPIVTGASSESKETTSNVIDPLVDTRSLCNVKATIQKLNNNNTQRSGNLSRCNNSSSSSSQVNTSASISRPIGKTNPSLCFKTNALSTKKIEEITSQCKNSDVSLESSQRPDCTNYLAKGFVGKCVRNQPHLSCDKSNSSRRINAPNATVSKRTPKLPGSDLVKKITANSSSGVTQRCESKFCDASLPPKVSSIFNPKERTSLNSRLPKGSSGNTRINAAKSPKLPTSKLGRLRLRQSDPLEVFNDKNLGDSGSSEGSERAFKKTARLSISDSCAELFSHGESGDEVFHNFP